MEKSIMIGENLYVLTSDDSYLDMMGDEFEKHMVKLFRCLVKESDIVADIGANIGITAILFSKIAKNVYAFEPSPSTFEILKANLLRAHVSNVEAINIGLGEKREELTITFDKNNRSGGFVSDKIRLVNGHITEKIMVDSLDNFFSQLKDQPTFMKIDVEGFEGNVIKGGSAIIRTIKPLVVLELNHQALNIFRRITIPDFFDFLRSVFPFLYAVDTDNTRILDLHDDEQSYSVMYEHLSRFCFPNLVGGFNPTLKSTLEELGQSARTELTERAQLSVTTKVTDAAGRMRVIAPPRSVKCNESFSLGIKLMNESIFTWSGSGDCPLSLCYHWQAENGRFIVFDGVRSSLKNRLVHPKEEFHAIMKVTAPAIGGMLKLIVTLVQENVCWFENIGFTTEEIWINVI